MQFLEANKYLIRYHYIYKYKSFHKAALNFYQQTSDRNMKYAVDQLESYYGVQLIKVNGNKLSFTEFGHILGYKTAEIVITNLEINSLIQRSNLKEVRFATSYDIYRYYGKPIFDLFLQEEPDIKMVLLKTNQYDAINRLLDREIDFVVGIMQSNPRCDLTYHRLFDASILLAVSAANADHFKTILSLHDLKEYRGAMNDQTDPFYENYQQTIAADNIELNIIYQTSDYESLINAVRDNLVDYAIVGNYERLPGINYFDISRFFAPVIIAYIFRKKENPTLAIEKLMGIKERIDLQPKIIGEGA